MARIADRVRTAGAAAGKQVQTGGTTIHDRIAGALNALRRRWPWFDHLAEAYGCYRAKRGGSLAGATTFFAFLSFFPLVALAFSVAGFAADLSPQAAGWLRNGIQSVLPDLAGQLRLESIASARAGAGIAGLLGLLLAGLAGVGSVRDGLHLIWGSTEGSGNIVMQKIGDIAVLFALGLCLLLSAAASAFAVPAASTVLGLAGLAGSVAAEMLTRMLAIVVAVIFNAVMFALVFARLSGVKVPRQRLLPGSLLGAVGFEALKLSGVYLVARTTHNPVYASFAVMVGLLVWINLVARLTFLTAAWTATSKR